MGRLVDQLCAACDESFDSGPAGASVLLFMMALLSRSPEIDLDLRCDPGLVTVARIRLSLERLIHGSKTSEIFLVLGLIRAIEDVLEDCAHETVRVPPDWSFATQHLLRRGVLIDTGGRLSVAGQHEVPALDRAGQARADLERWRKGSAPILEGENLEVAIQREVGDEDV